MIGTPDFLAPEQARNPMGVDIRADIYALGGTLYYLLTGEGAVRRREPDRKAPQALHRAAAASAAARPDAPPQVEQIVHWCMAKQPEVRPADAACNWPWHFNRSAPATGRRPIAAQRRRSRRVPAVPGPIHATPSTPPNRPRAQQRCLQAPAADDQRDPIRRRAEGGFPWSYVLIGLGALLVAAIFGYGLYLGFTKTPEAADRVVHHVGQDRPHQDGETRRRDVPHGLARQRAGPQGG